MSIKTISGFNRALTKAITALDMYHDPLNFHPRRIRMRSALPHLQCAAVDGLVRPVVCCPVTLVALHRTGDYYTTGQLRPAGKAAGVALDVWRAVFFAADDLKDRLRPALDRAVARGIERQL